MNTQTRNNETNSQTRSASLESLLARSAPKKRPAWQAEPSGLSREETRRIVLEMIG